MLPWYTRQKVGWLVEIEGELSSASVGGSCHLIKRARGRPLNIGSVEIVERPTQNGSERSDGLSSFLSYSCTLLWIFFCACGDHPFFAFGYFRTLCRKPPRCVGGVLGSNELQRAGAGNGRTRCQRR